MDALVITRNVAEIIFILLFIIFVFYAIRAVKKISASVEKIEDNTQKLYSEVAPVLKQVPPILNEVSEVVADIKDVAGRSKEQYYKVEGMVDNLVGKVNEVSDVIGFAGSKAKYAVNESSNLISAISKGVKAFRNKLTQ
jgi:uncharacterized protein YoxC